MTQLNFIYFDKNSRSLASSQRHEGQRERYNFIITFLLTSEEDGQVLSNILRKCFKNLFKIAFNSIHSLESLVLS